MGGKSGDRGRRDDDETGDRDRSEVEDVKHGP